MKRKNAKQIIALLYKQWRESCEESGKLYGIYKQRSATYGETDILTRLAGERWQRESGMLDAYQAVFQALGLEIPELVKISLEVGEGK